jgi:hypothetical protein
VLFALGNALMNDSWFSQTIDPSQTGSTSLIFFKWLRENKIALAQEKKGIDKHGQKQLPTPERRVELSLRGAQQVPAKASFPYPALALS